MARDRANIRTNIWADDHWRELTVGAQWLYEFILTSAGLNLCGVMDWRPAKWTGMSSDVTRERIEGWAAELEREHFVVVDRDKEEVLIRAFFRHDGILSQPNPMKGAAREFATIGSALIRGVISHEVSRLAEEFPNGIGKANVWELVPELRTLRKTPPIDIRNPSGNPFANPSSTSTSTSTSTEASLPANEAKKKPDIRMPKDWAPTREHYERAKEMGVDIADAVENFRLHAETHDRHAASWNGAFTTWLKKTKPTLGKSDSWAAYRG
jgi:hypothetical protein